MLGLALRVIAILLFLIAAFNQTLFKQSPADLVAFGLSAYVLATLCDGYWGPWRRAE